MSETPIPGISPDKKRKRPRAARACELCRAKKYRCDELLPCSHCKKQKVDCIYDVADHVRQRMLQSAYGRPAESTSDADEPSTHLPQPLMSNAVSQAATGLTTTSQSRSADRPSTLSQTNAPMPDFTSSTAPADNSPDVEVTDFNPHTQNAEFHGKTSSIAFLAALQTQAPSKTGISPSTHLHTAHTPSLVSAFHNEAFSPPSIVQTRHEKVFLEADRYHFRPARVFLDGYFQNIHFIHPILDKDQFMSRCEDLWFGRPDRQPKAFVALYYSIMSLGALTKTWDEEKLDGMGRLEWSRKLFHLARVAIDSVRSLMTVEAVQCLFFMAKVCQNELNPSLAYMYLGQATRASFSAGFNRKRVSKVDPPDASDDAISKLWWGLYSIETEISFSLGRPDSLGLDAYHNQVMPPLDETETGFIPVMVQFAKIIKEVTAAIYLSEEMLDVKAASAAAIESKMNNWLQSLPATIKPSTSGTAQIGKIHKDPTWAKRQRLVLGVRVHNVKMILFRPFLAAVIDSKQDQSEYVNAAVDKCVEAAKSSINLMHDIFCNHIFFRSWYYNTTYNLYAASIVLCYALKVGTKEEKHEYLHFARKAVEILDAMEESIVARNASKIVQQIISAANNLTESQDNSSRNDHQGTDGHLEQNEPLLDDGILLNDNFLSLFDLDENHDFLGMTLPFNDSNLQFWNDIRDTNIP